MGTIFSSDSSDINMSAGDDNSYNYLLWAVIAIIIIVIIIIIIVGGIFFVSKMNKDKDKAEQAQAAIAAPPHASTVTQVPSTAVPTVVQPVQLPTIA
jgi:uncharacterized membrane protein